MLLSDARERNEVGVKDHQGGGIQMNKGYRVSHKVARGGPEVADLHLSVCRFVNPSGRILER